MQQSKRKYQEGYSNTNGINEGTTSKATIVLTIQEWQQIATMTTIPIKKATTKMDKKTKTTTDIQNDNIDDEINENDHDAWQRERQQTCNDNNNVWIWLRVPLPLPFTDLQHIWLVNRVE